MKETEQIVNKLKIYLKKKKIAYRGNKGVKFNKNPIQFFCERNGELK